MIVSVPTPSLQTLEVLTYLATQSSAPGSSPPLFSGKRVRMNQGTSARQTGGAPRKVQRGHECEEVEPPSSARRVSGNRERDGPSRSSRPYCPSSRYSGWALRVSGQRGGRARRWSWRARVRAIDPALEGSREQLGDPRSRVDTGHRQARSEPQACALP